MRYHSLPEINSVAVFGKTYCCDHPVYSRCTLYYFNGIGLAVIQQRYDPNSKHTWWSELDAWTANQIYLNPGFIKYFNNKAATSNNGIFPTVSVRQIMWALRMKPLKREPWETVFDHNPI